MRYTITGIDIEALPIMDGKFHPLVCADVDEEYVIDELLGRGCHNYNLEAKDKMLLIYNDTLCRFSKHVCERDHDMCEWFNVHNSLATTTSVDDLI